MKVILDEKFLAREYTIEKKPMHQIADESGCAVGTVFNYIKKYGIESRIRMNEETKKKISASRRGKPHPRCPATEETKRRISESHKGMYRVRSLYGGHTKKRKDGYISVYVPDHPAASKDGYVMEHILVMEQFIGRRLKNEEVVHHVNKIRDDNRIENLRLMTRGEHARMHNLERHRKRREAMTYQ